MQHLLCSTFCAVRIICRIGIIRIVGVKKTQQIINITEIANPVTMNCSGVCHNIYALIFTMSCLSTRYFRTICEISCSAHEKSRGFTDCSFVFMHCTSRDEKREYLCSVKKQKNNPTAPLNPPKGGRREVTNLGTYLLKTHIINNNKNKMNEAPEGDTGEPLQTL